MSTVPDAEKDSSFDLAGFPGSLRVDLGGGMIRIVNGKNLHSIPEESLLRIEHHPVSWRLGSSRPGLRIRFLYRNGSGQKKTEIALAADDPQTFNFVRYLESRFPCETCLGPNPGERERVLSKSRRGVYGLHALHILTPAGVVLGILLVCVLILTIIMAESMPARALSDGVLQQVLLIILGLALIPTALMTLIAIRVLMTLRTDTEGLTIRRIFGSKKFAWRDVDIGEPRADAFNVYTGMFCYYSDRIDIVSSRHLVEIPFLQGSGKERTLRLNLEEAAPFFRELYYRGKVPLETARKTGAFL